MTEGEPGAEMIIISTPRQRVEISKDTYDKISDALDNFGPDGGLKGSVREIARELGYTKALVGLVKRDKKKKDEALKKGREF